VSDTAPIAKPPKVAYALYLLYSYLAIGVAACFFVLPEVAEHSGLWVVDLYVLAFFTLGFSAGFISEIRKGRNWARVTFVVLSYLGIALSFGISFWSPSYSPFQNGMFCLQAILVSIPCAFLIQPEASAWFKAMERARKESAQKLAKMYLAALKPHELAELETLPADEPLLVLQYNGYKHVWEIIGTCLAVTFFGALSLVGPGAEKHMLIEVVARGGALLLSVAGLFGLIDSLLLGEVRLYRDRIVQERKLIANVELRLADAGYIARRPRWPWIQRPLLSWSDVICRPISIFNSETNNWIGRMKGIRYDERLIASGDLARMHLLLAALTGRKAADFRPDNVAFKKLVAHQPQADSSESRFLAESS
jgi:hypothetical protein